MVVNTNSSLSRPPYPYSTDGRKHKDAYMHKLYDMMCFDDVICFIDFWKYFYNALYAKNIDTNAQDNDKDMIKWYNNKIC